MLKMRSGGRDLRGKDTSEEVANNTTNTVLSEHIKGLVNTDEELELGGKVADDTAADTEDDSRPGGNITSSGGDGDETGNDTRAETNG